MCRYVQNMLDLCNILDFSVYRFYVEFMHLAFWGNAKKYS